MGITLTIMDDVLAKIRADFPDLEVELFPEAPHNYRLNHPTGALLLSFPAGQFGKPLHTGAVVQQRDLQLRITLMFRQLNGRDGAIDVLDRLRLALVGYQPAHCRRRMFAVDEKFIGNIDSIWQYALAVATETLQIQEIVEDDFV